jgi:hypothetical protein
MSKPFGLESDLGTMVSHNTWKYATLALMALIGVALSIPQASAHITTKTAHVLEHIYNFVDGIEERTDNLPDDPADQSLIEEQLADIQTSIGSLSTGGAAQISVQVATVVNPTFPNSFEDVPLFPLEAGTTYSGKIAGTYEVSPESRLRLSCPIGHQTDTLILLEVDNRTTQTMRGEFNEDFVCDSLGFNVFDYLNGEADHNIIKATGQAFVSLDATQIPS